MNYARFAAYNVVGGVAWVSICLRAGRAFGRIEFVRKRFELVILAIIAISVLPAVFEIGQGLARRPPRPLGPRSRRRPSNRPASADEPGSVRD